MITVHFVTIKTDAHPMVIVVNSVIYSRPMNMHHSSDAHSCGIAYAVQIVLFIFIIKNKCNVFEQKFQF